MKRFLLFLFSSVPLFAVSMNFNGAVTSEGAYYINGGLGLANKETVKEFLYNRALLQPNVLVDDHFIIKSEWNLLTSPLMTPNATVPLGQGQGGYVLGDVNSTSFVMSRAWLEWTSDFGILRVGRMPVSWGYGLIWDAGSTWDFWQETLDRIEYRLHLGHIVGGLAYSKGRKLAVLGNTNDQEFYTAYLQYDNPEMDVEGGILYEKQSRSTSQASDWLGGNAGPYALPANYPTPYPLATHFPYPSSNNVVDVYLKKTVGYFNFGGEVGWLSGQAFSYNNGSTPLDLNSVGALATASYEYHKFKAFLEFLFAEGDNNLNATHMNGFVLMSRNRSPGIILGQELLGPYYGNNVGMGSYMVYGNKDSFSGVMYLRPGFHIEWSPSWSSGMEFIYAQKAATQSGEAKSLGFEIDANTQYAIYKNFDLGVDLGYLFPGDGLGVPNGKGVFGFLARGALRF